MNKEVNHVLQGSLLTLVVIGAIKVGGFLMSIPPPPEEPKEPVVGICGNAAISPKNPATYSKGKVLFQENCSSCHSVFKDLTGPALGGVSQRLPDRKMVYKWVRNPAAVLKSGNVYFNTLKKRFGDVQMTAFDNLSNDEIDAILDYVESH
ncbi:MULTISPECIES: c-type cytochrome [Niastella]|uniref:Cytochrome c n=1 Tax=Niastella soli TaxID=2821487 RepID=A0ABS3YR27_9BACT|nr:cytochrome c [Niastella soli]MBO9200371.1 cytochrome c [Niastella soli]